MAAPRPRIETEAPRAGFFGKAPSQGDFVSNRFDRALKERFDHWLQSALVESRRQLGDRWALAFEATPVWRFALGAEVAGGAPAIGVMAPSADRVGRAFPLVLATRVLRFDGPTRALCSCARWFDAAEALVAVAANEDVDLADFDDAVARLDAPSIDLAAVSADAPADRDRSFWWRENASGARGARFASAGFPAALEFHRLLGDPAPASQPSPEPASPRPAQDQAFPIEAAAASNAGSRHRINADAIVLRRNLFAVVDGVGDQPSAADAARVTALRLDSVADRADTLDDLANLVKGALGGAHAILRAGAPDGELRPSASVAALAVAHGRFAVLWAGDARCMILRGGAIRTLTRDHVEIGFRRELARSVGGPRRLAVEATAGALAAGDRFLLLTAPLAAALNERVLAQALASAEPQPAVDAMIQEALVTGLGGNVTALAIHVRPER